MGWVCGEKKIIFSGVEGVASPPMSTPRVPVQIPSRSERVQAALKFAAGPTPGSSLSGGLCYLCEQLAAMTASPIASAYVLEGSDELVLRGTWGYQREVIGEVRLKV